MPRLCPRASHRRPALALPAPPLFPQILINAVAAASLLLFQGLVGFVLGGMQGDEAAVSAPLPRWASLRPPADPRKGGG